MAAQRSSKRITVFFVAPQMPKMCGYEEGDVKLSLFSPRHLFILMEKSTGGLEPQAGPLRGQILCGDSWGLQD